jgi:hypothetical protein
VFWGVTAFQRLRDIGLRLISDSSRSDIGNEAGVFRIKAAGKPRLRPDRREDVARGMAFRTMPDRFDKVPVRGRNRPTVDQLRSARGKTIISGEATNSKQKKQVVRRGAA